VAQCPHANCHRIAKQAVDEALGFDMNAPLDSRRQSAEAPSAIAKSAASPRKTRIRAPAIAVCRLEPR
jgi:hypothetical protein